MATPTVALPRVETDTFVSHVMVARPVGDPVRPSLAPSGFPSCASTRFVSDEPSAKPSIVVLPSSLPSDES